MEHVNYEQWAFYLSSLFNRYHLKVNDILEIACGTGSLSLYLHKLGYNMTSTDLSPSMLQVAARKFKENFLPVRLFAANMVSLPVVKQFDAVICMYDSMNYLTKTEDFQKALSEISKVIKPEGIFIFDICTIKNSVLFFSNHSVVEDFGNIRYERKCIFHKNESIQENSFIINSGKKEYREKHLQRIYRISEVDKMLSGLPFKKLDIFDDMSFHRGSEDSERVHFILKKLEEK
jgi:ubiquinone/menaquinone biosynthesis C-methylase UbiE